MSHAYNEFDSERQSYFETISSQAPSGTIDDAHNTSIITTAGNKRQRTSENFVKYCIAEYDKYKSLLHESLLNVSGRVSFTGDMWTACTNRGSLTLTAHYVDDTHVLNLIVQRGLKEVHESVEKLREVVKYIDASGSRSTQFEHALSELQYAFNGKLCLDVVTRWNTTYIMLRKSLEAKDALILYTSRFLGISYRLDADEWDTIQKNCDFLLPFYDITMLFSSTEYPTTNLYFVSVLKIEYAINQAHKDPKLAPIAAVMLEKFEGYWEDYCLIP
ncbi:zinc finger BED domain-containing protein RICESLEEPER 2-like [Chenopodium quinoa]|uniref:zinc finger BED domain-containing protein RICESLEEPER 2-like n=1 Tax=Chenopodium quinoa TaxID=63459 RepID=UPI000B77EE9A|nr:zinc finger BED domain-containing protein RICESLEEPER 2-like [Chenopodium quinoa]